MFVLKDILAKDPADVTEDERSFLVANADSLSDEDKSKFGIKIEDGVDEETLQKLLGKTAIDAATKSAEMVAERIVGKFMDGVADARKKVIDTGQSLARPVDQITRKFFRALIDGDMAAAKALTTTSPVGTGNDVSNAGISVPPELSTEILRLAQDQYGIARREMYYLPFSGPGNTRTIPALGTSVSVFWTLEGAKKSSTQPTFNIVTQTLKKLAAIVPFTEEILDDTAINLTELIAQLFAEAIAKEEDFQFFVGVGTPWTGILNSATVNRVNSVGLAPTVTADDLLTMIDATPTAALAGAKFYFGRDVLSKLRRIKDSTGQYIVQNPVGDLPPSIWGYPYVLSDSFPATAGLAINKGYVLFGNLKQGAIFGDKQQLRTTLLTEATVNDVDNTTPINLAQQDMMAIRVVERVGYVISQPSALTVLRITGSA